VAGQPPPRDHTYVDFGIHLPLGASGKDVRAVCPQCAPKRKPEHRNEKDLAVDVTEGVWFCHHCEDGGSLIRGWKSEPVDPPEGYRPLPPVARPKDPPKPPRQIEEPPEHYVARLHQRVSEERGISVATLKRYGITTALRAVPGEAKGADGKPVKEWVLAIPYHVDGKHVHTKYRRMDKKSFFTDAGTVRPFYGLDDIRSAKTAFVVEGEYDKLALADAGIFNVVSVPDGAPNVGANTTEAKWEFMVDADQRFANVDTIVLAADDDGPGRALNEELARRFGEGRCRVLKWPGVVRNEDGTDTYVKDANDFLRAYGAQALAEHARRSRPWPVEGLFEVDDFADKLEDRYSYGPPPTVSTGWRKLDRLYRIQEGLISIVTGVPGAGKSTWLNALMMNLMVEQNWRFAVCSPEWQPIEDHQRSLMQVLMGKHFYEPRDSDRLPRMTREEMRWARAWLNERCSWILPEKLTIPSILARVDLAVTRMGVKGVVIDPWSEIETSTDKPNGVSTTDWIGICLRQLRQYGRKRRVHVWLVAHPTKLEKDADGEWPVPSIYDISGSAHFANMADSTVALWRSLNPDDKKSGRMVAHIQKSRFRHTGEAGTEAELWFDRESGRYAEVPEEWAKGMLVDPWAQLAIGDGA
jgi:twinkle protein